MISTYSDSQSDTYTEARAQYVLGKIFDDFHNIGYRGFDYFERNPDQLRKWREDIYFLMTKKVLKKFQVKFAADGKEWAVEYTIKSDGSIQQDDYSGGVDYWEIPAHASIGIVATWDRHKKDVETHMQSRGWVGGGSYVEGDLIDDGAYSKSGYGATKGRRGAWRR